MIFVVFVCTSAMLVMSVTITCRCWVDSDPEKQALMMVLATTPSVRGARVMNKYHQCALQAGHYTRQHVKRGVDQRREACAMFLTTLGYSGHRLLFGGASQETSGRTLGNT